MNPEEGELRPQLLDRFGLCVTVSGEDDPDKRTEVIRHRMAFEDDPGGFSRTWEQVGHKLSERIQRATELVTQVVISDETLTTAARAVAARVSYGVPWDVHASANSSNG